MQKEKTMVTKFEELSERQRLMLRFIDRYQAEYHRPPTIREIGTATGIRSTSVVNYNLDKLVEAGYLQRSDRVSRGILLVAELPDQDGLPANKILRFPTPRTFVPLIGHIVASMPVEMPEDSGQHFDEDDLLEVPPMLLRGAKADEFYAMRVRGDSMMDAMISEGDIVIMRRQKRAKNGEMVVVWLPSRSETTMKYYYHEGDRIRLQPAHPMMDPIYVDPDDCEIYGRVVSVMRQL